MAPGLSRKGSPCPLRPCTRTLYSRAFLAATLERAIRSFAASLASLLTASGAGIIETDWGEKFSVAGMASVVTILFAIAGGTLGEGGRPLVQRWGATGPGAAGTGRGAAGGAAAERLIRVSPAG